MEGIVKGCDTEVSGAACGSFGRGGNQVVATVITLICAGQPAGRCRM